MRYLNKLPTFGLVTLLLVFLNVQPANTQSARSIRWERFDVDISNVVTSENRFDVVESYELYVEAGSFGGGDVVIPIHRLTDITNISVTDGGNPLALRNSAEVVLGTYYLTWSKDNFNLTYDFIERAYAGETRSIQLRYTVVGALRSYAEGDQLYWVAIPADKPIDVMASRVTVQMPTDRPPEVYTSYPNTWSVTAEGNTLTWLAPHKIDAADSLEVRVQYKHDPAMTAPPWQTAFDSQRSSSETSQFQPTFVTALIVVLTVFIQAILFGQ